MEAPARLVRRLGSLGLPAARLVEPRRLAAVPWVARRAQAPPALQQRRLWVSRCGAPSLVPLAPRARWIHSGPSARDNREAGESLRTLLKQRLQKALMGRYVRPWKVDDVLAMFSWLFLGHTLFFLIGTTTFVSLIVFVANSLQVQEFVARQIGAAVMHEMGVTLSFESAIVPQWRAGALRLTNVSAVRNRETQKKLLEAYLARQRGQPTPLDDADVDGNFTYFELAIDEVDVALSLWQWLEGRGWIKECALRGVRGTIDRRHVWYPPNFISKRRTPQVGDFELDRLVVEDARVTLLSPDFRPIVVAVYAAEVPLFRKQWMLYDLMCADKIVGQLEGSLFSVHKAQATDPAVARTAPLAALRRELGAPARLSHLRIDNVRVDLISSGASGPLGWLNRGTMDIDAVLAVPEASSDDLVDTLRTEIEEIKSMALDKLDEVILLLPHETERGRVLEEAAVARPAIAAAADSSGLLITPTPPWAETPAVYLFFRVQLNNLKAAVPAAADLSTVSRAMIRPIVAYMNANRTSIPLQFGSCMDLKLFDGAWSIYNSGLVDVLAEEIARALTVLVQDERERTRQLKKVGLWGIQTVAKRVSELYEALAAAHHGSGYFVPLKGRAV